MRSLIDFWKRDIINKLIVIVILILTGAMFAFGWLLFNMPQGMSLQQAFSDFIPVRVTPTFDMNSYLTPNANITAAPTATATEIYVSVPTFTPYVPPSPISAVDLTTPALEVLPTPALALPTQQIIQPTAAQAASAELACIPNNPRQTGRVVEVVDGNTVRVLLKDTGLVYTVRYIGIAAPENKTIGESAKQKNGEIVYGQGKEITLVMDKTDKDDRGRLLRYVIIDNIFINMEMIRKGFGAALDVPPDSSCAQVFQQAEQTARAALTGIWAPTPTKKP